MNLLRFANAISSSERRVLHRIGTQTMRGSTVLMTQDHSSVNVAVSNPDLRMPDSGRWDRHWKTSLTVPLRTWATRGKDDHSLCEGRARTRPTASQLTASTSFSGRDTFELTSDSPVARGLFVCLRAGQHDCCRRVPQIAAGSSRHENFAGFQQCRGVRFANGCQIPKAAWAGNTRTPPIGCTLWSCVYW